MSLSEEQMQEMIQEIADAVTQWRMQENIYIAFFACYVYFVLTTIDEEVTIIRPQKWNRGKWLYVTIRYGLLVNVFLHLTKDYRNYFSIPPSGCKGMNIVYITIRYLVPLASDFSLALCLGALLQVKTVYLIAIITLSCGLSTVTAILQFVGSIQYPAEEISPLDAELGYPCYYVSTTKFTEETIGGAGQNIRAYANLAATTVLVLIGLFAVFKRYRGQGGELVRVVRRDAGLHYLSVLALRLASAILYTPSLVPVSELDSDPVVHLLGAATEVINPMLAQRLLINMRKVDYMGSEPVASKLLFAPAIPGSEDEVSNSFEMSGESSEGGIDVERVTPAFEKVEGARGPSIQA